MADWFARNDSNGRHRDPLGRPFVGIVRQAIYDYRHVKGGIGRVCSSLLEESVDRREVHSINYFADEFPRTPKVVSNS